MNRTLRDANVLVTGGAGFIGSNLVDALLEQGNRVVCLDNFFAGRRENLSAHADHPRFTLMEGDIRDLATCRHACDGAEYVLHQAAVGSVPRSVENPILSTEVNVMGFLNVLVAARDAGVKRFVYAASSSTYGDSAALPKVEDQIGKPLSPYGITKYANELYAGVFSSLYGIETIGLRYFNVFGRRQDPGGAYAAVIPKFAQALLNHERPVIHGDGSHSRDFTYVDNVVQVNQLAALTDRRDAVNTIYNVACGERTTLNDLFATLREHLAQFDAQIADVVPVHAPERAGDIPHSFADIDKARNRLGYDPRFSFDRGIRAAARWYAENLGTGHRQPPSS